MEEESDIKEHPSEEIQDMIPPLNKDSVELSQTQKERMEQNRLKAVSLRKSRIRSKPYQTIDNKYSNEHKDILEDSKGGYMIESTSNMEDDLKRRNDSVIQDDPPVLADELMVCDECKETFAESFLWSRFSEAVCDTCRDPDGKHTLITKTEAKEKYLLKDCDFGDHGGPPLQFILKKNPHSFHGDMKLFMTSQVRSRAHLIWGGEEGLESERERRIESREKRKHKKYVKQVKDLRKAVYSTPLSRTSHEHIYKQDSECYDSSQDIWTKSCFECGHTITFEKM